MRCIKTKYSLVKNKSNRNLKKDIFNPICTCTAAGVKTRVCLSWTIYVFETLRGKLILTIPGIFFFLANGSFFLDKHVFLEVKREKIRLQLWKHMV